jgi:transposase
MRKKYIVTLTQAERQQLSDLIAVGKGAARRLAHARILLKTDQGPDGPGLLDDAIAQAVEVSSPTIGRVRKLFVEEGLEAALNRRLPRRVYVRKLDGEQEARLIAEACSAPPAGNVRWTLRLLADRLVELEVVDSVSHETVRQVLKKTNSSPG